MLVTVSVTMVILSTPNSIFLVVRNYWDRYSSNGAYDTFNYVSRILVSLNNAVNFYLYFISGQKFRQQCIETMCFCRRVRCLSNTSRTNNGGNRININISERRDDKIRNHDDINRSEHGDDKISNHDDINFSERRDDKISNHDDINISERRDNI
jgi:hypothetical protein